MQNIEENWKIKHDAPIGPQLHHFLRQRIIQNDLLPGYSVSEMKLAQAFSVSRQPIREVFIKLAKEGLLEIRPQRGTFVRKISITAVTDARFVREAIEADVVKLLAQKHDKALIHELRTQLIQQHQIGIDNPHSFIILDELFHRTLTKAAGKCYAWNMVEGLKSHIDRVRFLSLFTFSIENLIHQHTAIVDAIEIYDQHRAEGAMRNHLGELLKDLPAIIEKNPEFFEDSETIDFSQSKTTH